MIWFACLFVCVRSCVCLLDCLCVVDCLCLMRLFVCLLVGWLVGLGALFLCGAKCLLDCLYFCSCVVARLCACPFDRSLVRMFVWLFVDLFVDLFVRVRCYCVWLFVGVIV